MKNETIRIINEYKTNKTLYKELGEVVYNLLKILIKNTVHTHQIMYRVKDDESLTNKLVRKNYKYDSLHEITDILGLRVILYFEDDIYAVEEILKKQFKVDEKNSMDKRSFDEDRFGYRSLHYIVSLDDERLLLPEYQPYKDIKFEVQIRSILQHSWAEIEHDIGYKGVNEIPTNAKRTFCRVAALLEQADIEFVKLKRELILHETELSQKISKESIDIPIEKSSLKAFIKESSTIDDIEKDIEKVFCPREERFYEPVVDNLLPKLEEKNIQTVAELEKHLINHKAEIIAWIEKQQYTDFKKYKTFFQGSVILWLLAVLDDK
ncbi:MAG: putative GTP pyrophosphokinase [Maribacter sp.]|jgi:putative GTP pyrophosphokinase